FPRTAARRKQPQLQLRAVFIFHHDFFTLALDLHRESRSLFRSRTCRSDRKLNRLEALERVRKRYQRPARRLRLSRLRWMPGKRPHSGFYFSVTILSHQRFTIPEKSSWQWQRGPDDFLSSN